MRYIPDHDMHIHTFLSTCSSDPCQTPQALVNYAKQNGFNTIGVSDHFWDCRVPLLPGRNGDWYSPQTFEHIRQNLPLPQDANVRFLFGGETEFDMFFNLGASPEVIEQMDYLLIPITHLHMDDLTIMPGVTSPLVRAQLWMDRFAALLQMDLPWHKIGLAHLTCNLTCPPKSNKAGQSEVFKAIPDIFMERIFDKAGKLGVGIELNYNSFVYTEEEFLKPYRIAKEHGCKFYLGSDTHRYEDLDKALPNFNNIIDTLGLTEEDKFIFGM